MKKFISGLLVVIMLVTSVHISNLGVQAATTDDLLHVYSVSGITTIGKKNSSVQMKADIAPGYVEDESVTWTSSDETIATVDKNGLVTVKEKDGRVTITATLNVDTNISDSIELTVNVAAIMEELTVDITKKGGTVISGDWYDWSKEEGHYGGSKMEVSGEGAYFEYTFRGTGVEVYAQKSYNMAAYDIYIDNVLVGNDVSLNANSVSNQQLVFSKTDLKNEDHTIKCVVVPRTHTDGVKTKANVDFLKIYKPAESITTETIVDDYIKSPETRNLKFNDGWKSKEEGCYGGYKSESQTEGDYLEYTFSGTGVEVYVQKGWNMAACDIYIDNELVADDVNLDDTVAARDQQLIFSKTDLKNKEHTVKIVVVFRVDAGDGATKKKVAVDYLKILEEEIITYTDKSELQDVIVGCETMVEQLYTSSTWLTFSEALQSAVAVMNDGKATEAEVTEVIRTVESAKEGLVKEELISIYYQDIKEYRCNATFTYPVLNGLVFSGWYTDEKCTIPLGADMKTGGAYAKFVDANVLTAKSQVTAGTTATSEKADIRFVSTVDSLDYKEVGFYITVEGREPKTVSSTTVYEKLYANRDGDIDTLSPDVFCEDSEFFFAYSYWEVPQEAFSTNFNVISYWTTFDGTKVTGDQRDFSIFSILYGDNLKVDELMPNSLTVSFFDVSENIYGFTFNTCAQPLAPVIKIKKNDEGQWKEYTMRTVQEHSYNESGEMVYYISKAEIKLEENTSYTYYAYDKGAGIGTEQTTLQTKSSNVDKFMFAHLSDSQSGPEEFGQVLSQIVGVADFMIHTGDVVETSKYESEWKEMLDANYKNITSIPIMAISGNHETTYKSGSNETFKHFNNMIPTQTSTECGYFYSFIYGDVKFIMLNTNDLTGNKLKTEQYNWLTKELAGNDCKWTIVSMHNPIYSPGKYGSNSSRNEIACALQEQLHGIFVQYGVDLVLQGHDHVISRTYPIDVSGNVTEETIQTIGGVEYSKNPAGVIYLENGPAGNQTREPESSYNSTLYKYAQGSKKASWAEVEVDGDSLVVTVKWYDGTNVNIYQKWGIIKDNPANVK